MSNDDEAARKARARKMRAEIDAVKAAAAPVEAADGDTNDEAACEAPRDFVHRRMIEIAEEEKKKSGS